MKKVERKKKGNDKGRRRACENKNELPVMSRTHIETNLPAMQAEQVEDDVAPVTVEYVPAKASDEEYG